jgi:hypothetical protein
MKAYPGKQSFILAILLLLLPFLAIQSQEEEITLRLSRNFGYGGPGEIQGVFTMIAESNISISRVFFYIDDQLIGEDSQEPFQIQFSTDRYPLGMHTLFARGVNAEGQAYFSNKIQVEFVSAEAGWQAGMRFAAPLLIILVTVVALGVALNFISTSKKINVAPGTERKYGLAGGSICPKCNRPTPLHLFGLNLGTAKFDRCENCRKWSIMRAIPLAKLRQAEAEELIRAEQEEQLLSTRFTDPEEKLRRELDDSRYMED